MAEAVDAVSTWFLSQSSVERVWATCDVENTASARVLEKAGFELEGTLRHWDVHPNLGGGRRDALCYSRIDGGD
jgi:RimJ/RimL family protein N-acetyltransferase